MGGSCFLTTINPDDFWIKKINFFKDVSMTKYLGEVDFALLQNVYFLPLFTVIVKKSVQNKDL